MTKGLTPLVGREQEVRLLLQRWEQVKGGLGHVILLSGEAGIGKSRLVQVLKEHVADEPHAWLECRCSPYYQNSALYPLIDLWERILAFGRDAAPDEKMGKLEQSLSQYRLALPEAVPLLAALLSLPLPAGRYPPLRLTPQRQRQKTLDTLLALVSELTEQQPVLFIVEDLHWSDPSTLEFLSRLMDQGAAARLLTILTCRPAFQPPWSSHTHLTPVALPRLPHDQVHQMVMRMTKGRALPLEILQQIVAKTDGVPLFVEELTKMVLESGLLRQANGHYELTGSLPSLVIPTTLHDSLMARLDRLDTAKRVAQMGAVLGRSFSYELLQAVSPLDKAVLQRELGRLVEAELLFQDGLPPQATYLFKHALIQETAYHSLLRNTRQQYHQRIAQVLAEQFPDTAETQPELLAHHYMEAGLNERAVRSWHQAGQKASERSALMEAAGHLTTGLELLKTLPDTPERPPQELALQILLGQVLIAIKGYAAPEVQRTYARARELCTQIGETPQLFWVLWGLQTFYMVRSELQTAWELGQQLLRLAQRQHDSALLLEVHCTLGNTLFWRGELAAAQAHLEHSLALYPPEPHRSLLVRRGTDPAVGALSTMALTLWLLGYPDQALERIHAALTLARELSHPFSLAHALNYAAGLHMARGEGQLVQERAEATIALATDQGFPHWQAGGAILQGWALAEHGHKEQGIAQMRQSIATVQAMGAEVMCPWYLGMLAEVYGKAGQIEAGLTVVAEALGLVEKHGERFGEAELYRLRGELLLRQATPDEPGAETCLQQALDIARQQQAKSLELRAAMCLSRLWQHRGKSQEARHLLAAIYGWFTEGLDTTDVQEARALLEKLT